MVYILLILSLLSLTLEAQTIPSSLTSIAGMSMSPDGQVWLYLQEQQQWVKFGNVTTNFVGLDGGSNGVSLQSKLIISNTAPIVILRGRIGLQTEGVVSNTATVGQVFTLTDTATGEGRWMNADAGQPTQATLQYTWTATAYSGSGPSSGHCAINNGIVAQASKLAFSTTDRNSVDKKTQLLAFKSGSTFSITGGGQTMNYDAVSDPIDNGTWVEWFITPGNSTGEPSNETAVAATVSYTVLFSSVKVAIVKNVTELQKVPTTVYQYATTQGYYDIGDFGAGRYYLTNFVATSTNYGNFQSTFDATKMWALLREREGVYLRQYGGKGDGVTDSSLQFIDWMRAVNNGGIGLVGPGVFMLKPYVADTNMAVSIRGVNRINHYQVLDTNGNYYTNVSVLKRYPTGAAVSFFDVNNLAKINLTSLVIDGNKLGELNNSTTLYFNNGGGAVNIENCEFRNSLGSALRIGGNTNTSWSVIKDCVIYDVRRGLRVDFANNVTVADCDIRRCWDNNLWLYQGSAIGVRNCYISDGGLNGVKIESSGVSINDSIIEGHKRACISIDATGTSLTNIVIKGCLIRDANCAFNTETNNAANATGTMNNIEVVGSNAATFAIYNSISDCVIGGRNMQTGSARFGANTVGNHIAWGANLSATYPAWKYWRFSNITFAEQPSAAGLDISPATPTGTTNSYEIGVFRSK